MRPQALFAGEPIPVAVRTAPYVAGVDRPQPGDQAVLVRLERQLLIIQALTAPPGSVFAFRCTGWH